LVLQYHSGDQYATTATEAKFNEYGAKGFPTIFFDGANALMGGSNASYDQQTPVINTELSKPAAVAVSSVMKVSGGITVEVDLTNLSGGLISGAKLRVVLYEDLGTDEHHFCVRDILSPVTISTMKSGDSAHFSVKSNYPGSTAKLGAVVYVQTSNGEVLQAGFAAKG
jgi:hypothetical protein